MPPPIIRRMEIASTVLGLTFIAQAFLESLALKTVRRLFEIWERFWFVRSVAEFEPDSSFVATSQ